MCSVFLSKLPDETSPDISYHLAVQCSSKELCFTVINETDGYNCSITNEEICSQSVMFRGYTDEKFLDECKTALTSSVMSDQFTYHLENDLFIIKKKFQNKTIKFVTFKLKKTSLQEATKLIFDGAVQQITNLSATIENTRNETESLMKGSQMELEFLRELNDSKNVEIELLYNRFLCLLNTKKERITALMNQHPMSNDVFDRDTDVDEMGE